MAISLYAATVSPFVRILDSVARLIEKADVYCRDQGLDETVLLDRRIHPDMLPFAYQVKSTAVHSIGAIEGVRAGRFSPDGSEPGSTLQALAARVADAQARLSDVTEAECESFIGKPMRFEVAGHFAAFTGEQFLLHFSLPNFYFHATTAYDLLRAEGLKIGKVDFIGRLAMQKIA